MTKVYVISVSHFEVSEYMLNIKHMEGKSYCAAPNTSVDFIFQLN